MNIDSLIDRDFVSVSVLEEMTQIAEWLKDSPYLAIVDEEIQTIGILLPQDAVRNPRHLVIDFDFRKPCVNPQQSPEEVLNTRGFVGVISRSAILAVMVPAG
jgi:hypothetical protein